MKVFKTNHLVEGTIGVTPSKGYRSKKDRQSILALRYFAALQKLDGLDLDHAGNGRERKIGGLKVDAICDRLIIEVHG